MNVPDGEGRTLDDLDAIPWPELEHAYGPASDVPRLLGSLVSADTHLREKAIGELFGNIYHQGTVYEATPHALPFLIRILRRTDLPDRESIAALVAAIIAGRGYYEVYSKSGAVPQSGDLAATIERERGVVDDVRRIGVEALPLLIPFLRHVEPEVRSLVAEAMACYPSQAGGLLALLQDALSTEQDEEARERIEESIRELMADGAAAPGASAGDCASLEFVEVRCSRRGESEMTEPILEEQLLGLPAKAKVVVGLGLTLTGAVACSWLWERGWIVGLAVFALVMGVALAWTGRQVLARERAIDAEVARARGEWDELQRGVAEAKQAGRSVARFLQHRGYREFVVRRWIVSELGEDVESE